MMMPTFLNSIPTPDGVWGWFTTIMTPAANEIFGTEPVFG